MAGPPPERPRNLMPGTTIDTSPVALGLTSHNQGDHSPESSPSRGVIQRTVEKLGRSKSQTSSNSGSRMNSSRLFSLRRKHRDKDGDGEGSDSGQDESPGVPNTADSTSGGHSAGSSFPQRPASPASTIQPPKISRPSLGAFGVEGSMRAGTQTLIQALQAIPWADAQGEDDTSPFSETPLSSEGEEEKPKRHGHGMASSIHTIYRPIARSRQSTMKLANPPHSTADDDYFKPIESDREDDDADSDFEGGASRPSSPTSSPMTARPTMIGREHGSTGTLESGTSGDASGVTASLKPPEVRLGFARTGSMVTVKVKRRVQLAEKLRDVFGLADIEEVVAEMRCWLLRSVLLQGYMYLTNAHLCFFAHMPSREDQILKSGTLSKKAQRTKRWNKHWFVLRNDVLSWYQSSSDPYFPHGNVDLRYAISCDPSGDKAFKLRTNQKSISLTADSTASRDEWVKSIRKVIFKCQNKGESVKIAIPFSVILDVDRSTAMDFTETIEVKIVDKDEQYTMDSYFFAYFHDLASALEQIREAILAYRHLPNNLSIPSAVQDTTITKQHLISPSSHSSIDQTQSLSSQPSSSSSSFKFTSLLRPFSLGDGTAHAHITRSASAPDGHIPDQDGFTHVTRLNQRPSSPSQRPPNTRLSSSSSQASERSAESPASTPTAHSAPVPHTYPPSPALGSPVLETPSASSSSWSVPVPTWLKTSSRRFMPSSLSGRTFEQSGAVSEVYEGITSHDTLDSRLSSETNEMGESDSNHHMGFSILETPDPDAPDHAAIEKFRSVFAFDEKETLLGYFGGYLFRVLPVYGRFYISTNYFCYRSSQPLTKTRMMIPIRDIMSCEKSKAFRFGHQGLVVIIKGHEEIFLEFGSVERRDGLKDLLEHQMEQVRHRMLSGEPVAVSEGKREALILEELEATNNSPADSEPRPPPESGAESVPAVMFTSASSTFLDFKPHESLQFTCLTIGSRGDVQPYIALCKELKKDGHRVRIATHIEYKDWIEGHGIEYSYVGGDPAELMRICVENGMFTVSFLRETLLKFRGWLDDLLSTSWEACQGSDVLIESPSAMGGIHIAEALQIPYYRAFTMPWSRTRAYPHAFAVPDHKMGGAYNYMTYVMFDQVFWRATSGQINRWRKRTLGIGSTNLDKLEQHKVPFLYNFSPSIVPPPLDWYEWIRVTGYWFLDDPDDSSAKKWEPPADLVKFIDRAHAEGKKVVYIGFGSIVVSDPDAMTRCVVESIIQSGVYAVLSKGWSDRFSTKEKEVPNPSFPPQIYPITSIPHDWLFSRVDAACHHGGAGTTGASLRAGIPTVIKPFFGDQFFWGDRVEALGTGSCVRKLTVDHLTAALKVATTDIKQIDRAKLLGETIRSEKGVARAVESIYRDLEYARSLIKRPGADSDSEDETIKAKRLSLSRGSPRPRSPGASADFSSKDSSAGGAMSDGWSVISGDDNRLSTSRSADSERSKAEGKRASLASAALATLQDTLSFKSSGRRSSNASRSDVK